MSVYGFFGGFSSIFFILFIVVFILVIGTFIVNAARGIGQWNKNNQSPILDVEATVLTKRTDVSSHLHGGTDHTAAHHTYSTRYYVTFGVMSGDRMEFLIPDREYGMLVEGDRGMLRFQGTRYLSFRRQ